jgi:hypothetical protein
LSFYKTEEETDTKEKTEAEKSDGPQLRKQRDAWSHQKAGRGRKGSCLGSSVGVWSCCHLELLASRNVRK